MSDAESNDEMTIPPEIINGVSQMRQRAEMLAAEIGKIEIRKTVIITDGNAEVAVSYNGILPDLFREGQGVVVVGRLDGTGHFAADEVLAKHDENYMPKEVADRLKEQGYWQGDEAQQGASGSQ